MCSQQRSSALSDPRHERLLVGKRVPAGFIGDLLETRHTPYTDNTSPKRDTRRPNLASYRVRRAASRRSRLARTSGQSSSITL